MGNGDREVRAIARSWGRVALALAAMMLMILVCGVPVFILPMLPNPETGLSYTPKPEGYRLLCLAPAMGFGAAAFLAGRARMMRRRMGRGEILFMAAIGLSVCLLVGGLAMAVLPPPEGYGLGSTPLEVRALAWICGLGPGLIVLGMALAWWALRGRRKDG